MPVAPNMGVLSRFGTNLDTTATAAVATTEYEFLSCALGAERELIRNEGMRGTRLHPVSRMRKGRITPGGVVELEPTYGELRVLLPLMISVEAGIAGARTYTVTDTVPVAFQAIVERVADQKAYTQCRTSRTTWKSSPGQPLSCSWEIEALDEKASAGTPFSGLTISNTPPFVFHEAVLTLNSTAYHVHDWEMVVDWHLKTDRWVNSQTRTDLPSMDFSCITRFTLPYTSDTTGLYDLFTEASEIATGVTGSIVFTKGGTALTFAWVGLLMPAQRSPVIPSRDEIVLAFATESRRTAAGVSPLTVTLDEVV